MLISDMDGRRWKDVNRMWTTEIPLTGISIPAHELWHPRFILVNSHDRHMFVRPHVGREHVYVSHDGNVSLNIDKMIVAECNMRLERCARIDSHSSAE